jgi:hypothetical protein
MSQKDNLLHIDEYSFPALPAPKGGRWNFRGQDSIFLLPIRLLFA